MEFDYTFQISLYFFHENIILKLAFNSGHLTSADWFVH